MSAPSGQTINPGRKGPRATRAGRRSRGELARSGALVLLAILITLFAVLNVKDVKVDWIFGSGHAPLIVVIVISLLVGIVLTYFAERLNRKRS
jgi:uncharacterized integral membrane protein